MIDACRSPHIASWLPDHLRVLRETVDAEIKPNASCVGLHLLILAHLLCAEICARRLVAIHVQAERASA